MADKKRPANLNEEELDIFGAHRSDEELAAEEAARKAAERAARREAYEKAKAARREANKEQRTTTIVMVCILAAIVVAVGCILAFGLSPARDPYGMADGSADFQRPDDVPTVGTDLDGCVTEAYFTNGGHLALHLKFVNGDTYDKTLTALEVVVKNEADQKIATGYSDKIKKPDGSAFVIPATTDRAHPNYEELIFYISPEYVQLPNDSLETLALELSMTHTYQEDKATTATSATEAQ